MSWKIVSALRHRLDRERGAIRKDWGGKMPLALVYPNHYRIGMSNLGFQAMYGLLNRFGDVVCERFFLPEPTVEAEHQRTGVPVLSLESQRPLAEFELVAFSVSYENDFPNILRLLRLGGLAPRRDDRQENDPPILMGGVTARTNPEPMADFLDLVLLGDGEVIISSLLQVWREVRSDPLPKWDRILRLARTVPGAYAPGLYRAALDDQDRHSCLEPLAEVPDRIGIARADQLPDPALTSQVMSPDTEFGETRLVEIGRGCARGCRFCLAGFSYRPPRTASQTAILNALGAPEREGERVGLVSPAAADHPDLEGLVRILVGQGRQVTVSSLRVEAVTPSLAEALALGRLNSAALAPEAGSERLRMVINKGLNESQIIDGVSLLAEAGVRKLKLYYMIGLPTETEQDVRAIVDLTLKIKDRLRASLTTKKLIPDIALTVASFVPKPQTPFQSQPMASEKELKARAKIIEKGLDREKGVRVRFDPPRWSLLQGMLSLGDRRTGELIQALDLTNGSLNQALKQVRFDPYQAIFHPSDECLPWSFIDQGFREGFWRDELKRAWDEKRTESCRPPGCRLCGVCSDDPGDKVKV